MGVSLDLAGALVPEKAETRIDMGKTCRDGLSQHRQLLTHHLSKPLAWASTSELEGTIAIVSSGWCWPSWRIWWVPGSVSSTGMSNSTGVVLREWSNRRGPVSGTARDKYAGTQRSYA